VPAPRGHLKIAHRYKRFSKREDLLAGARTVRTGYRSRDLACDERVISSDVGRGIVASVLQFDFHAGPKLVDIEASGRPVDADALTDPASLVR
jgi:hypothetical protein